MVTFFKSLGVAGAAIVIVVLAIAITFGGIWLNGQFQRAQNNADTNARQTSQQYIQAEQSLMEGLVQDWYREGCDQQPNAGVCISILNRLRQESTRIDAQYVPPDVSRLLATHPR